MEFSDYALTWWNQLQEDRFASGNEYVHSWTMMKRIMRHHFVPSYYERQLYKRLQGLTQGSRTMEEYYKEMEVLLIRTKTQESNDAKMARFLHGINDEISDFVEMFPYDTLQDVVHQAMRVEKKNMRNGRSRSFQNRTTSSSWQRPYQSYKLQSKGAPPKQPSDSTSSSPAIHNQDRRPVISAGASSAPPAKKSTTRSSNIQCHKCKGRGHISAECPSRRTMIINDQNEWESESDTEHGNNEVVDGHEWEVEGNIFFCEELQGEALVVCRSLMTVNSANVLDEGLRIGGRGCQMNSKVKISQTRQGLVCIENKRGSQLAQSQSVVGRPLLAPLYRWPGLEEQVGFNTNYNISIWYHLIFRLHLYLGLPNGPQGYQDNGPY
jgi:hypothetical protein